MSRRGIAITLRDIPIVAYILGGTLAALSAVSWIVVAQANIPMTGTFELLAFLLFTSIWAIAMVAMMFPSIIPMAYAVSQSSRSKSVPSNSLLASALFVLGYVGVWTLLGVGFYLTLSVLATLGYPILLGSFGLLAGGILIATGLYQFTRFKQNALMKCRSPMGFIVAGWRNGRSGALLMGRDYGLFCTRCCWVLMAGLLIVGAMSLPLMGVFTVIIFAEKIGPIGQFISKLLGAAFVLTGIFLIV